MSAWPNRIIGAFAVLISAGAAVLWVWLITVTVLGYARH